ncbi:hypothetical protein [Halomicrobium urmianum]|uniref:hypothetical protein n=1 Tax=Halomicrobium urmianum TaxID=1586233 RepID=UPI001CDA4290|nr:hypothetical protein [Halomicrobium urmianum]
MGTLAAVFLWGSAGVALLWTAYQSRSQWSERAVEPFTALVGALGASALAFAGTWFSEATVLLAAPLLVYVTPLLWALFVFEYTGRYAAETRRRRALLAFPSAYIICAHYGFSFGASAVLGIDPWEYEGSMASVIIGEMAGPFALVAQGLSVG